uniref:Uncharacterized protein n=1 Tax=Knipowitschia caucasica TaxID=637954 RepID=A0AAV2KUN9_KNICA
MEEIRAAAVMTEDTRDLETLPQLNLEGELSTGDGAEVDSANGQTQIETPTQQPSTPQNRFQYVRRTNEKRRKVAPLDSIGRFKM